MENEGKIRKVNCDEIIDRGATVVYRNVSKQLRKQ